MPDLSTVGKKGSVHKLGQVVFEDEEDAGAVVEEAAIPGYSVTLEDLSIGARQRLRDMGERVATGRALAGQGSFHLGVRWPVGVLATVGSSTATDGQVKTSPRKKRVSVVGATGRPRVKRDLKVRQIAKGSGKKAAKLLAQINQNYGALRADRYVTRRNLNGHFTKAGAEQRSSKQEEETDAVLEGLNAADAKVKICPTVPVNPILPKEIDANFTAVHFEGAVKFPSSVFSPPVQMWEPFVLAAILLLIQFEFSQRDTEDDAIKKMKQGDLLKEEDENGDPVQLNWHERHVERFLQHTERSMKRILPMAVLRLHTEHPSIKAKESRFFMFLDDFLRKKFDPHSFGTQNLQEYVRNTLFDPFASKDQRTPRAFCAAPWLVQLLNDDKDSLFQGQYTELMWVMKAVGLPIYDVVAVAKRKRAALTKNVWSAAFDRAPPNYEWQRVHLYLDNMLISRRYGGFSFAKDKKDLSKVEEICIKKLGATVQDILAGKNVVAVVDAMDLKRRNRTKRSKTQMLKDIDFEVMSNHSHRSFFSDHSLAPQTDDPVLSRATTKKVTLNRGVGIVDEEKEAELEAEEEARRQKEADWEYLLAGLVDPEDLRFRPLGLSLTEMFLMIQGMVMAMDTRPDADADGTNDIAEGHQRILRTHVTVQCRDRHVLAAAVLIDLYMREKVDIWAWEVHGLTDEDKNKAAEDDLWAGNVASVYRVLAAENAPLWTNEAPFSPDSDPGDRGDWHWMEPFIKRADGIFEKMAIPPLLEESIWLQMLDRGVLEMLDEDIDILKITKKRVSQFVGNAVNAKFPRLAEFSTRCWNGLRCLLPRRPRCCAKRKLGRAAGKRHAAKEKQPDHIDVDGETGGHCCEWFRRRDKQAEEAEQRKLLAMYEYYPVKLPFDMQSRGVRDWFLDLEDRRVRCRGSDRGTSSSFVSSSRSGSTRSFSSSGSSAEPVAQAARRGSEEDYEAPPAAEVGKKHGRGEPEPYESEFDELPVAVQEDGESEELSEDEEIARKIWWERVKTLYMDAYNLMFEETVLFFEADQEAALFRSQLLMFFFALQSLFEVAWEGHNGFERMMQALSPPFAKLPLKPPKGMEYTGAIIRGLCRRARAVGDSHLAEANLAVEAGMFHEQIRERLLDDMFSCSDLFQAFNEDGDDELTLQEFVDGIRSLPTQSAMRFSGMPKGVLDALIVELAMEVFLQMDEDGSGTLTSAEVYEAVEARRQAAEARRGLQNESAARRVIRQQVEDFSRLVPGTKANKEQKKLDKERRARLQEEYERFAILRARNAERMQALGYAEGREAFPVEERLSLTSDMSALSNG